MPVKSRVCGTNHKCEYGVMIRTLEGYLSSSTRMPQDLAPDPNSDQYFFYAQPLDSRERSIQLVVHLIVECWDLWWFLYYTMFRASTLRHTLNKNLYWFAVPCQWILNRPRDYRPGPIINISSVYRCHKMAIIPRCTDSRFQSSDYDHIALDVNPERQKYKRERTREIRNYSCCSAARLGDLPVDHLIYP